MEKPILVVRRSKRVRKPIEKYSLPELYSTFMLNFIDDETKLVWEEVNETQRKI
jgi:hypothetical protein